MDNLNPQTPSPGCTGSASTGEMVAVFACLDGRKGKMEVQSAEVRGMLGQGWVWRVTSLGPGNWLGGHFRFEWTPHESHVALWDGIAGGGVSF